MVQSNLKGVSVAPHPCVEFGTPTSGTARPAGLRRCHTGLPHLPRLARLHSYTPSFGNTGYNTKGVAGVAGVAYNRPQWRKQPFVLPHLWLATPPIYLTAAVPFGANALEPQISKGSRQTHLHLLIGRAAIAV